MTAYYNEFDPFAAQWLRNLIDAGHIAPGVVDERDMREVDPSDLEGFTQCHFFAGLGGWSYALRLAGWPDDKPVWTGSTPCQPFSAAGKQLGVRDERHLAPHFLELVSAVRPPVLFGEQVAAAVKKDDWLDDLLDELEREDYATGAIVLPACGVGAPHIRQRLWFIATRSGDRLDQGLEGQPRHGDGSNQPGRLDAQPDGPVAETGSAGRLPDTPTGGWGEEHPDSRGRGQGDREERFAAGHSSSSSGGLGDTSHAGLSQQPSLRRTLCETRIPLPGETTERASASTGGLEHPVGGQETAPRDKHDRQTPERQEGEHGSGESGPHRVPGHGASPTDSPWGTVDWLFCRDGKWRPVRPGSFPLAHRPTARVGRLRAYGNAIVPQVAAEVIKASGL